MNSWEIQVGLDYNSVGLLAATLSTSKICNTRMDPVWIPETKKACLETIDSPSLFPHEFQHVLLFLATECRRDIAFSSSVLSTYDATTELWNSPNIHVELLDIDAEWTETNIQRTLDSGEQRVPRRYNELRLNLSCDGK